MMIRMTSRRGASGGDHDFVVVELQGRLGNQLFQFASGYAVARRRDARLLFSARRVPAVDLLLPELIGDLYREPTATELLRVGAWGSDGPAAGLVGSATFHATRGARRLRGASPPSFVVWNDTGRFRPEVFDLDLPVRLVGHLQTERYFVDVAEEIVDAVRLPPVPAAAQPSDRPTVGVSFRRGDYNTLGWALPLTYYERALGLIVERVGPVALVLFGDDPDFVELAGPRLAPFGAVTNALVLGADPIAQLAAMARCHHHVIANSSFAWWGAWLGDQRGEPGRLVVAPTEFVGIDRVPLRWLTLESGVERF
jgi:hypothetical protein